VTVGAHRGVVHRALVYSEPSELVARGGAYLRDGLEAGELVLAIAPLEVLDRLREELGADSGAVDLIDVSAFFARLGRGFAELTRLLDDYADPPNASVRLLWEHPLEGRLPLEARAYLRYEAAINVTLAPFAASILCAYDGARLPDDIVSDARRTHPELLEADGPRRSESFTDPAAFLRGRRERGRAVAGEGYVISDLIDLAGARSFVRAKARRAGLQDEALADLLVAATEVAGNALLHGDPPRELRMGVEDGLLMCHVSDSGPGMREPFAGFTIPEAGALSGHGLWVANQLCDLVDIATGRGGTDVGLYVRLHDPRA
jgi:anti-sigma regulatory factor (Ser/Thr protein kinase)